MGIQFQLRRDTSVNWTSVNPVLVAGEPGYDTTSGVLKIGDGTSDWLSLEAITIPPSINTVNVTPTTYVIPLDVAGAGKQFTDAKVVDTNATLSVGPGQLPFGCCAASYVGDGSHNLSYGPFINTNGYVFDNTQGKENCYFFVFDGFGNSLISGYAGGMVGLFPPTLVSATVDDANPARINLVWSKAMNSTISASSAFTVSSGHTLTAHTLVDSTHTYLTSSTAFITGESAKTLAYTQPASNPMKDLASNFLLSGFTGTAITNNVVSPTLVSAIVANSTPTKIDLTWSKSIPNATLSATANFAVNTGHTLTGTHTWIDATHSQLTTSAAFVASETKTLAYTANGTNDMADTSGNKVANFTGFAITDNVGGAGSITYVATLNPTPVNFTTAGMTDWIMDNGSANYYRKGNPTTSTPTGIITLTKVNITDPGWGADEAVNVCDAGDCSATFSSVGSDAFGHDAQIAGDVKLQFTCPATASAHHAYVYFDPGESLSMTLRLSLSDASIAPVVITVPAQSQAARLYTITYNSGLSGTFTASLETGAGLSSASYFLFNSFAYKAS